MRAWIMAMAVVAVLWVNPAWARAGDDPLVTDLIWGRSSFRMAVPKSLGEDFRRYVSEDPAIVNTANDLIAAARSEIAFETRRFARLLRDGGDEVDDDAAIEKAKATVREIEKRLRSELRAIIPADRPDASLRFERAWRRCVLRHSVSTLPIEPETVLRENGLKPSEEPYATLIASYERDFDALIREYSAASLALRRVQDHQGDADSEEMKKESERAHAAFQQAYLKLSNLLRATTLRLVELTPETVAQKILDQVAEKFAGWYGKLPSGTTLTIKEVRLLSLDPAQRQEIDQIERDVTAKIDQAKQKVTNEYLREPVQDPAKALSFDRFRELHEFARKLTQEANRKVLAILTREQREAYERSPMLPDPNRGHFADFGLAE